MKKINSNLKNSIITFLFLLIAVPLLSQKNEITHGREYWLGIPHCKLEAGEPIRFGEFPIMLWISSKVATTATVSIEEMGLLKNLAVQPNRTTILEISDLVMNKESEKITNYGIHVTSKDPITVVIYMAYKWSGEAYRCIPVEWLGKKYYTTNMYLDKTDEYKPGQFLIIGTQDKTTVSYTPVANTVEVDKGKTKSITINKGQCYLVEGRIDGDEGLVQDYQTDLTGTKIVSDKPIAVISGHTKGAFPRYSYTMLHRPANFMRNMMTEMLWPVELLGSEYISVPILYRDRPRDGSGQADNYGDLIRIIASENDTKVWQMRQDGSGYKRIGPDLDAGEYLNLENHDVASQFRSNKPVMVAQYGKAWLDHLPTPQTKKDDDNDQVLNPRINGQGMLLLLAPIDHWTQYAQFRSPTGIDNFIYLTFKSDERFKIKYDDQPITAVFGTEIRPIEGTEYAYITKQIGGGDHFIIAEDSATFACYAYGNWDYSKDGFAYGYPTGINYASRCEDSLLYQDTIICGNVVGEAWVEPEDSSCAIIFSARFIEESSYNYLPDIEEIDPTSSKRVGYALNIIDLNKPAHGVIEIMTRSGDFIHREFDYVPEDIIAEPDKIDFGVMSLNQKKCFDVTLKNPTDIEIEVSDLRLAVDHPEFTITSPDLPVKIEAHGEVTIEACATAIKELGQNEELVDTIIAGLSCYDKPVCELKMRMGDASIYITDADFGAVPINTEKSKKVTISNTGTFDIVITDYTWDDKLHFPRTSGLDNKLPITIKAGQDYNFIVYYKPDEINKQHIDTAYFTAITLSDLPVTETKPWSEWKGEGLDAGPVIQGYDFLERRVVNPPDQKNDSSSYEWYVKIWTTGNDALNVDNIKVEDTFNGVYELDLSGMPAQLNPGDTIYLPVFFKPNAEGPFNTDVTITTAFDTKILKASDGLLGTGVQPHVDVTGYDFKTPILVTQTSNGTGSLINFGTMDLEVDDLIIEGTHKKAFEIDWNTFNQDHPNRPIILKPDESIDIPYIFKPYDENIIDYTATVKTVSNSWNPDEDQDNLTGHIFVPAIKATDWDFETWFKTTASDDHEVYLINNGTNDITVKNNIVISGQDPSMFTLKKTIIKSTGEENPVSVLLKPGDTLACVVMFQPFDIGSFEAQIDYETDFGSATSLLWGKGKILRTVARIPDNYKAAPSLAESNVPIIEVFIDKDPNETELLSTANIYEFECYVQFETDLRTEPIFNVYPDLDYGIIQNTTMTEGWNIVGQPEIIDDKILYVHMRQTDLNKPLNATSDSDVLFAFKLQPFLGQSKEVPLPVDFEVMGVPKNYVEIENIPGKITINSVCVDNLRLVKAFGVDYALHQNEPNPVDGSTTISYGVGLEARTTIELFNSSGEKVAVLLDQVMKPGEYEFEFNAEESQLPSGVYHYRMHSGPFTDVKSMVITK